MKSYFIISVFVFGALFSKEDEFLPLDKRENTHTEFSVIPYLQSYGIFPGFGISFRGQKGYWGAQLDANMADTSLFGVSYDYEMSLSALYYPLARKGAGWRYGGLYLSAGLGAHLNTPYGFGIQLCSPFFLGYQAKWFDLSAGTDLVYWIPSSTYYVRYMLIVTNAAPSVKVGFSF